MGFLRDPGGAALTVRTFHTKGVDFAYEVLGADPSTAPMQFVWAHGWGQNHQTFMSMAGVLQPMGSHILLDFPGFGASSRPKEAWGTEDYAEATAALLASFPRVRRIWVGHSFGCRVGLQLAANHPEAVDGLFLIAAAGLPRQRTLLQKIRINLRVRTFKALKALAVFGLDTNALQNRFGSTDYRNAGALRPIFLKVVRENLTETAAKVRLPVQFVYGAQDVDTPPSMGETFAALIPGAELTILPRFDHMTILSDGAHQVQHRLGRFIERVKAS